MFYSTNTAGPAASSHSNAVFRLLNAGGPSSDRGEERWAGGEAAALAHFHEYLWDDALALRYVGATMTMDKAKSCLRDPKAMTRLSPWLAHGCISPRYIVHEVPSRWLWDSAPTQTHFLACLSVFLY